MLVGAIVAFAMGRCLIAESGEEAHLERGLEALAAGIGGETDRFAEAESEFARASGATIFDAYPLFLLELSHVLATHRADESDVAVRVVMQALARGDVHGAIAKLPTIPGDFPGRQHLERAVVELARRLGDGARRGLPASTTP